MKKQTIDPPKFANTEEEADWWASRQGREFLKQKSAAPPKKGRAKRFAACRPTEPGGDRTGPRRRWARVTAM